jgi:AraC-like DNA-binding protein
VGEALHCLDRHHDVLTQAFGFRFRVKEDCAELRWFPAHPVVYDIVIFTFDVAMASFHTWLTRVLRKTPPAYEVHCSLHLSGEGARYDILSPARLCFGEGGLPDLRIQVPLSLLEVPMPQADDALRARMEAQLLAVRPGNDGPQDRVAWLRLMLRNARGHQPTQAELADVLGVSVSTLSRQLGEQGYSFRTLANEVRHEQACELLRAGAMTVQDVATLQGYAEPANFVRAFRAMAGVSPGVYARQRRAGELLPPDPAS